MIDGVERQACVYTPPAATPSAPRSLVVWFHPGGTGGDVAEQETHLLDKALATGFHLAVVQGRNLHFPTEAPRDGRHHDFYYRDLASPSSNPDIASADHLIDLLVGEGAVDPRRIHAMGWSNGAFFGQLYAIARHTTPTPGGSRIASAAVFSAADPFGDISVDPFTDQPWLGQPRCALANLPESSVPILMISRTCDAAVPCGATDLACFGGEPNYETAVWVMGATGRGVTGIEHRLIGGLELGLAAQDRDAQSCTLIEGPTCDPDPCSVDPTSSGCLCLVNHLRWPDGDYPNGTGVDREPTLLAFLRDHPLP
jgi:pimeloyl-ACP methyl ester carboxylesterase